MEGGGGDRATALGRRLSVRTRLSEVMRSTWALQKKKDTGDEERWSLAPAPNVCGAAPPPCRPGRGYSVGDRLLTAAGGRSVAIACERREPGGSSREMDGNRHVGTPRWGGVRPRG